MSFSNNILVQVRFPVFILQSHPEVIEAGKKALDTHGAGLSSVRFICGTHVSYT